MEFEVELGIEFLVDLPDLFELFFEFLPLVLENANVFLVTHLFDFVAPKRRYPQLIEVVLLVILLYEVLQLFEFLLLAELLVQLSILIIQFLHDLVIELFDFLLPQVRVVKELRLLLPEQRLFDVAPIGAQILRNHTS